METLHLDVSLVYTSPLSAPANTVQHVTSLSHHKASVLLDISQAPKPGRAAAYPAHLQPVSEQGVTPSSSEICALVFAVMLCWALQPTQCSSVLHSEGHENCKCKFIKLKNKEFLFSIFIFNCLLPQSYTNVKFTTCLSIFSQKPLYVNTLPEQESM